MAELKHKHDLIKKVTLDIYKKRITELLNTIHSNYPLAFKKEHIKPELDILIENIIFNIGKIQPKINKNKNKIIVSSNTTEENKTSTQIIKKIPTKNVKQIDTVERCNARVWNSIFDRKTGKEVTDIDDCYKVSDFNDIDNEKFHKKYIIGSRCCRKKSPDKNYCAMHSKHAPHGDFEKLPSKEICLHFIKDGNY